MKALERVWRARLAVVLGVVSVLAGCAGSKPEPKATEPAAEPSAKPVAEVATPAEAEPSEPLPELRTGVVEPEAVTPALVGRVLEYGRTATTETFRVHLPDPSLAEGGRSFVVLAGAFPAFASFVEPGWQSDGSAGGAIAWLRRKRVDGAVAPLSATILVAASWDRPRARSFQVEVPVGGLPKVNPKLEEAYLVALRTSLGSSPLSALLGKVGTHGTAADWGYHEWTSLMRLSSGYDSVESALHANATLRLTADPKKATVPLASLQGPTIANHPWAQMTAALRVTARPEEPLARATPREFYFVRANGFEALQALLDEADTWLTAGVRLARGAGRRHDLVERYRQQLGLSHSELTRWLGPKLVRDLALLGSDPFVRQGSDVSLVIRPLDAQGLANALSAKLALDHPSGVQRGSFEHGGVRVLTSTTPDGSLRQFVAHTSGAEPLGAVTVVSNSRGAIERILDVVAARSPSLASELDFQYMLARDAGARGDVLAYVGDAFVQTSIGPRQRILDARRQLARAELSRLGYAALLFAWLEGREPKDANELLQSRWFDAKALQHTSGEKITFTVGQAPRSSLGTPSFMTPLIDLPTPAKVTPEERDAYRAFAQGYMGQWVEHVDPIAARFSISRSGGKVQLSSLLRVLPVVNLRDYREVWRMAGSGQVLTRPVLPGAQATLAIGPDSELRKMLSGQAHSFLGKEFKVDWLGDWVTLGLGDEAGVARALQLSGKAPEVPTGERADDLTVLRELPLFLVVDVKNSAVAGIMLALLRRMAQEAVPDQLSWGEHEKRNDVSIVRVRFDDVDLYYALTKRRLFVSLQLAQLRRLLDSEGSEGAPERVDDSNGARAGGQLQVDFLKREPSGLLRAIAWGIEHELRERLEYDVDLAEAVLRGTPNLSDDARQRLAMDYLGFAPITSDGAPFRLESGGITDPLRGSAFRPVYPNVPVAGSALERLLKALGNLHVELGFDVEPGSPEQRSLRTTIRMERPE